MNGLKEVMFSGQITSGQYSKEFEKLLQSHIGNPLTLTTSNNNIALLIALNSIGVQSGDEIIASPASCLATNQPVIQAGGIIRWCDIDPETGTLNPESVRKSINSKTKAIIHYHWGGYPGYIDEINNLAKEHGLYVIEDASEAFEAMYKGKKIGNTNSDIVCFSFQPVRLLNTLDGGAICFNNEELYNKALLMRDYGIDRKIFRDELGEISPMCDINLPGFNGLLNNINSFIGIEQLKNIPDLLKIINLNSSKYINAFSEVKSIKFIKERNDTLPSYWIFSLCVKNPRDFIHKAKIFGFNASQVHLRNDIYSLFSKERNQITLKGVDEFYKHQVSIPVGWWLSNEDIEKLILFVNENC